MQRSIEDLEADILELSIDSRAEIATRILTNLARSVDVEPGFDDAWTTEAERRDREIEEGTVDAIPAHRVFGDDRGQER